MDVTKSSSINDVLRDYPETIKVFEKYNMGCLGCMGATAESIENGAMMHDIDSSIIVKEINNLIHKEKK
jgi:hybrid cluster-associated redox disulfide protein